MAISITSKNSLFNAEKNASILFIDLNPLSKYDFKKYDDFILIFSNKKIVGINVFNYSKYFELSEGFHSINNNVKEFLLNRFKEHINEGDFDDYFKIGKIIEIKNHPNSDKLKVLKVLIQDSEKQIITNVQNIVVNNKYLFAMPGSITFDVTRIIGSKILNLESDGMIISYKSIGINKEGLVDCSDYEINDRYEF